MAAGCVQSERSHQGGDGDADPDAIDACGSSPFVGHHLWKVGNCEVGTRTPVDAQTCQATVCGGNAREEAECDGERLFDLQVDGADGTMSTLAGDQSMDIAFERSIDCATQTALDAESCDRISCLLAQVDDLYVVRTLGVPAEDEYFPDDLWLVTDRAWPATNGCRDDAALEAQFADLEQLCPR